MRMGESESTHISLLGNFLYSCPLFLTSGGDLNDTVDVNDVRMNEAEKGEVFVVYCVLVLACAGPCNNRVNHDTSITNRSGNRHMDNKDDDVMISNNFYDS